MNFTLQFVSFFVIQAEGDSTRILSISVYAGGGHAASWAAGSSYWSREIRLFSKKECRRLSY